jgi:hypothetical protein
MMERTPVAAVLLVGYLVVGCARVPVGDPVFPTPESAIREAIARELGMAVSLEVETFREHAGWAFVAGRPLTADRAPIDYARTPYARDVEEGYFDDSFAALARRAGGRDTGWSVVELSLGATDAPFVDWPDRHGLPRTLVMPGRGRD